MKGSNDLFGRQQSERKVIPKRKPSTVKRKIRRNNPSQIVILLSIVILCVIFAGLIVAFNSSSGSFAVYSVGDVMYNSTIDVVITSFEPIKKMKNFTIDNDYSYFLMEYQFTNKTDRVLDFQSFYPYIVISEMKLVASGINNKTTKLVVNESNRNDEEKLFDFEALKAYGLNNGLEFKLRDNLLPNETRKDIDIIKISKAEYKLKEFFITIAELNAAIPINNPANKLASRKN
jgi:hypothetical protein